MDNPQNNNQPAGSVFGNSLGGKMKVPAPLTAPHSYQTTTPKMTAPVTMPIPMPEITVSQAANPLVQPVQKEVANVQAAQVAQPVMNEAEINAIKLNSLKNSIIAGNIPQMVLSLISYALAMRSSDIHIEPYEELVVIRYRVDGILRKIVEYPRNLHPAVVSRIKIMSNLKIDEQRIPQDGRTEVTTEDGRDMDLRVSTLPTTNGEKVVMRIQDKSRKIPTLEKLGISGMSLEFIKEALLLPNGIILTTGPTGSGKTTTLYAALQILNTPEVNILTIEDPVEITLQGLNQSQVHPDINYTFATGLRTALRQDPDIIMVGEIRDHETINIAIEASLTGHLVLSTIHTNSAVETLTRIINMDIEPFLMVSTINIIIAQRLVRKVCENCKEEYQPDEGLLARAKRAIGKINEREKAFYDQQIFENVKFYIGKGCDKCNKVGYFGRVGLYEVMKMTDSVKKLILAGKTAPEVEEQAIKDGMVTLEHAGIISAMQGVTTLSEVYRVARGGS